MDSRSIVFAGDHRVSLPLVELAYSISPAVYGARYPGSWSCQDLVDRGRLGATGGKVPQNTQPESPGRQPLGGLQL